MADNTNKEKNLIINRYTVWTVPNILVFIRILCVPVYMSLLIFGSRALAGNDAYETWWIFLALGVMAFAAFTDLIDGKIARRFPAGSKIGKHVVKHDQGTYVGQVLDPIGDKVMHIGILLALTLSGYEFGQAYTPYLHWAFLVLLVFREVCMVVMGSILVDKINVKSNMPGKVASAIISVSAILCCLHGWIVDLIPGWHVYTIDWVLMTIGIVLNWASAINYGVDAARQIKRNKAAKSEAPAEEAAEENAAEEKEIEKTEE